MGHSDPGTFYKPYASMPHCATIASNKGKYQTVWSENVIEEVPSFKEAPTLQVKSSFNNTHTVPEDKDRELKFVAGEFQYLFP